MADIRPKAGPVRFYFTMNMQSRSGNSTHQVIGEVPSITTLDALLEELEARDFLLVEEFYKRPEGGFYSVGEIILNTLHIGKVKLGT